MITVGLDFGTHQTKVCIERKEGVELNYSFMKFEDTYHRNFFTIPSLIGVGKDDLLSYGYLPRLYDGRIIRYFKQRTFRPSLIGMSRINAMFFSIWYLAFILFDLEKMYGRDFSIQMGAPTDCDARHVENVKQIATRIIASAYQLVEDVFENDKKKFLSTTMHELVEMTQLVPYSKEIKDEYGLLVFPEAYACLKPLVSKGRLAYGTSLMIDIGGGTTDMSLFTIRDGKPQVYDFYSINKGLNYLTGADENNQMGVGVTVKESEIDDARMEKYIQEVNRICSSLRNKLQEEFKKQTSVSLSRFNDGMKHRPLVYCGGGSTFKKLRLRHGGFHDIKQVSHQEWNTKSIDDIDLIIEEELCPILSTAYGLAISTENDDITMRPFRDIFEDFREMEEFRNRSRGYASYKDSDNGLNHMDIIDACK